MGNSSELRVGDPVVTIGYNFGSTGPSMTGGLVSKTDYVLAFPAGGFSIPNIIQSDVTVNPGNSGGPLIDKTGKIVGMIYGRLNPVGVPLGQFPGMTAVIPSNIVNRVASSIVENGYYLHPGIGIIGETLTPDLIQRMVNSTNIASDMHGVFVSKLQRGGTADLAGLQGSVTNEYGEILGGDIITSIDGFSVDRFEQLLAYIQEHKSVGDEYFFQFTSEWPNLRKERISSDISALYSQIKCSTCIFLVSEFLRFQNAMDIQFEVESDFIPFPIPAHLVEKV